MTNDYIDQDTLLTALETAMAASREAGEYLKGKRGKIEVIRKKARRDDLLDADLGAEQIIIKRLQGMFPDHEILSEETEGEYIDTPYRWVVDPLDGSANFQHGSPVFAVSISLLINKKTTVGVVYLPMFDEMFTAIRGQGAYLNGNPIHVSDITDLDAAMIYVGDFAKDGNLVENSER